MAQWAAALIGEHGVVRLAAAFLQPCPQRRCGILAQRRAPLLSPLAVTPHVGAGAELDILASQSGELRGA